MVLKKCSCQQGAILGIDTLGPGVTPFTLYTPHGGGIGDFIFVLMYGGSMKTIQARFGDMTYIGDNEAYNRW